jgi:hypothetical protein
MKIYRGMMVRMVNNEREVVEFEEENDEHPKVETGNDLVKRGKCYFVVRNTVSFDLHWLSQD